MSKANKAAKEVLNDLRGRKGIGDELEGCDREIQEEIEETLTEIIERIMNND